jgi:hypothetical protein
VDDLHARMTEIDKRNALLEDRLTKLTQATSNLGKHVSSQNGKFDTLMTKLDGMAGLFPKK